MELNLNDNRIYDAIHRFYSNFTKRLSDGPNPNQIIIDNLKHIKILKIYCKKCIYSNDNNIIKDNIVIVYLFDNLYKEVIHLNLLLEDYKDIFKDIFNDYKGNIFS